MLGTDGFGRSDTRENLRQHFEVSRQYIVVAALKSLADMDLIAADKVLEAIKGTGGTVLKTSLDHSREQALRDALAGVSTAVPAAGASTPVG